MEESQDRLQVGENQRAAADRVKALKLGLIAKQQQVSEVFKKKYDYWLTGWKGLLGEREFFWGNSSFDLRNDDDEEEVRDDCLYDFHRI